MDNTYPVYKELAEKSILLDNLYLDPNNPRFTSMYWSYIPENLIIEPEVQKTIEEKLTREFSVEKLILNIQTNGYLPIDRVIVRPIYTDKYVVLEGNRRICAAKILKGNVNGNIDDEIMQSIKEIPCLVYVGEDSKASWTFQGLRHIMGIYDWSSFNKAQLIVTLMEEEELSLTEVGKKFGLTGYGAGQWARGYYAYRQAKESSDYANEIDERSYIYFQEIFGRSNTPLRNWLNWSDEEKKIMGELNFNEFLSWLYPRDSDEYNENTSASSIKGDWNKRRLARSSDLRSISYLIREAPVEFEYFMANGDLEKALNNANTKKYRDDDKKNEDPSNEAFETIESCIKVLENLPIKIIKNDKPRITDCADRIKLALEYIEAMLHEQ